MIFSRTFVIIITGELMRTKRSILALLTDLGPYSVIVVLGFYRFRLISDVYGIELFGLLQVIVPFFVYLNMYELGLCSAFTYKMYRPFLESNFKKTNSMINGAKIIFKSVGAVIILVMIFVAVSLPRVMGSTVLGDRFISVVFLIYLSSNFIKYFIEDPYKFLLLADQKQYKINIVSNVLRIVQYLLEIILVMLNFTFIIVVQVSLIFSIVISLTIKRIVEKNYSWLDKSEEPTYDTFPDLWDISFHSIADIIIAVVPGIIIAFYFDLSMASLYGVVNLILQQLFVVFDKIFTSIKHSYGTLFASEDSRTKLAVFDEFISFTFYLSTVVSLIFFNGVNNFIGIWMSSSHFSLSTNEILLFTILLYVTIIRKFIRLTHDVNRLYTVTKYFAAVEVLLNIYLSLFLVKNYGIGGIVMANIVSSFSVGVLPILYVILTRVFNTKFMKYMLDQLRWFAVFILHLFTNVILMEKMGLFSADSIVVWLIVMFFSGVLNVALVGCVYLMFSSNFSRFINRILSASYRNETTIE